MDYLVELDNVGVDFGTDEVLRQVNMVVEPGSCIGVSGSNGAGKTTLLRVVATLQPVTAGRVSVLGVPLKGKAGLLVRTNIGLIGHAAALNEFLTLRENLEFIAQLRDLPSTEVDRVLQGTGLQAVADRRADHSSRGMRRRTDLARLAMTRPKLLLLDEPYSGLDIEAATIVDQLIESTKERGGAVLIVSHNPAILSRVCDRAVSVQGGAVS